MNPEIRALSKKLIIMKFAIKINTLGYTLWDRRRAAEGLADSGNQLGFIENPGSD